MPDFTSALYLGLRHASGVLRPWEALTSGTPAAVRRVPGAQAVAARLAALQGCEAATLLPSTLHAAWDLGAIVEPGREAIHCDADLYPVLGASVSRAVGRGATVHRFAHGDAAALERSLRGDRRRPVVLVDGLCPACGGPAPLSDYMRAVRRRRGLLVIDDTQALGILGRPGAGVRAWGAGGGGSLRFHRLGGAPDVLVLSSIAKALGAPLAALSGSRAAIARYEALSETRVHCSPVSIADVHALEHALAINRDAGEQLRRRAAAAVTRLRRALSGLGVRLTGGAFVVQALPPLPRVAAAALHRRLLRADVHTVPQAWANGGAGRLVFLLRADTSAADVDAVVAALASAPELALLRGHRPEMERCVDGLSGGPRPDAGRGTSFSRQERVPSGPCAGLAPRALPRRGSRQREDDR